MSLFLSTQPFPFYITSFIFLNQLLYFGYVLPLPFLTHWLCLDFQVFVAMYGLSLLAASGGCSPVVCRRLTVVASLVAEHGLQRCGLSSCGEQALLPCSIWDLSSRTKDQTCVSCISRQILNHSLYMEFFIYGIQKDGHDNPICETVKETQMYRTDCWTLWEKARVG